MRRAILPLCLIAALSIAGLQLSCGAETSPDKRFGQFIGSTPRGKSVASMLLISESKDVECTWNLELLEDQKGEPSRYKLTCEYGKYDYQKPKVGQKREAITKEGSWKFGKSTKSPHLRTFELKGGPTLLEISKNVLHLLGSQGELLVGDGGYSYSLHRAEVAEKPGDWHLVMVKPDLPPYKIAPLSTGPNVYAVLEGRTPYKGIAEQFKMPWDESFIKAKWRITLYQDEKTKAPSEYKMEGSLFRPEPRTGDWSLKKGEPGKWSRIILNAAASQPELVLLVGDEKVFFIADKTGQPLVGHSEFSYTMNRHEAAN